MTKGEVCAKVIAEDAGLPFAQVMYFFGELRKMSAPPPYFDDELTPAETRYAYAHVRRDYADLIAATVELLRFAQKKC